MLRQAKRDGLPISADVSINHLHLSDIDISGFNSLCHVLPPLRERRDLQALREALADGMIDAVCSDHNPQNQTQNGAVSSHVSWYVQHRNAVAPVVAPGG